MCCKFTLLQNFKNLIDVLPKYAYHICSNKKSYFNNFLKQR